MFFMVAVVMVVMSPVPTRVRVVWLGIHHLRLGIHYRCGVYDHGLWGDDHGYGSDHEGERQPHPNGDMQASCVCREWQGKACETQESDHSTYL